MKIALIGGIGSGKSSVLNIISSLGERVCDCDAVYKELTLSDKYINIIDKEFGVVKDGVIDKKALGELVFANKERLQKLNSIAHPLIFERLDALYKADKSNLYIEVSAFDKSMQNYFDIIICVSGQKELRVQRVIDRSGYDKEYIEKVMQGQLSQEQMQEIADYIIVNDGDFDNLRQKVKCIVDNINKRQ